jgi:hypothetical protein
VQRAENPQIQEVFSRVSISPPPVQLTSAGTDSTQEVMLLVKALFNGQKSLSTTTRPVHPHTPTMGSETTGNGLLITTETSIHKPKQLNGISACSWVDEMPFVPPSQWMLLYSLGSHSCCVVIFN